MNKRSILALGITVFLVGLLLPLPAAAQTPPGTDPNHPIQITLDPNETEAARGTLAAGEETWYTVKVTDQFARDDGVRDEDDRPALDLTLFGWPLNGFEARNLSLDIFQADYAPQRSDGRIYTEGAEVDDDSNIMPPFGSGRLTLPDDARSNGEGDSQVQSLLWSGNVNNNQSVLVRVFNGTDQQINYRLYTNDVIDARLGQSQGQGTQTGTMQSQ